MRKLKRLFIFLTVLIIFISIIGILSYFNYDKIKNIINKQNENNINLEIEKLSLNENDETWYGLKFTSIGGISNIEYDNVVINALNKKDVAIDIKVKKDENKRVKVTSIEGILKEFEIKYMENQLEQFKLKSGYVTFEESTTYDSGNDITAEISSSRDVIDNDYKILYSINDGQWIENTGIINNLNQNDKVSIKAVGKNTYGETDVFNINIPISENIDKKLYDGDKENLPLDFITNASYIVKDSAKGKNLNVHVITDSTWYPYFWIYSYDENWNKTLILQSSTYDGTVIIPNNSQFIEFVSQGYSQLYELSTVPIQTLNINRTHVVNITANGYSDNCVPENLIDGSFSQGYGLNWYGGTRALIEYDNVYNINEILLATTSNWGSIFNPVTLYYSEDDSLELNSDLTNFNSITINTDSYIELNQAIKAKRIMITKPEYGAAYEFICYGEVE